MEISALERRTHLRPASLSDLDALVGDYITGEKPAVQWMDSHALFRFETRREATAALHDPYYQRFFPHVDWKNADVVKVRTYRPYSTDLKAAWLVVERLSDPRIALELCSVKGGWRASFGGAIPITARSAPVAICLAGLRFRGIEVEVSPEQLTW